MRKIFYYNFLPTKAEEVAARDRNEEYRVTRSIVGAVTRDPYEQPVPDSHPPWVIRKTLLDSDISSGQLSLSHHHMFEHVFRYWDLALVRNVVILGYPFFVKVFDFTDETSPKKYETLNTYVENGPNDTYMLGLTDLIRDHTLRPGDEIGLYWDTNTSSFNFKVLHRGAA